jgi:citrate lyase subunit beta-like protein
MFAPNQEEVEWAVRVAIADDKAAATGRGAWTLDGKMIDAPVVGKARAIIKKAEDCGFDVDSIMSQWQAQEPE